MSKSEWAAWAQAIGVVAALLLSVFLSMRESIRRNRERKLQYARDRLALKAFIEDVIHFVGPIQNSFKNKNKYKIDAVESARLWGNIKYFEDHLHDPSADRALKMLRNALRDSVRHLNGYEPENSLRVVSRRLTEIVHLGFRPDQPDYIPGEDPVPLQPSLLSEWKARLVSKCLLWLGAFRHDRSP